MQRRILLTIIMFQIGCLEKRHQDPGKIYYSVTPENNSLLSRKEACHQKGSSWSGVKEICLNPEEIKQITPRECKDSYQGVWNVRTDTCELEDQDPSL